MGKQGSEKMTKSFSRVRKGLGEARSKELEEKNKGSGTGLLKALVLGSV